MIQLQKNTSETVLELAKEALDGFCDDLSTMFEVEIECSLKESGTGTAIALKKHFKKLGAVHMVKAEGDLSGEFPLLFDQGGLFILAGVIVMLPEARIKEEAKRGSEEDAEAMSDAVGEVGNLLVGTWDRVFREEFEGHKHFVKSSTYVGQFWDDPKAALGLAGEEECEFALYDLTVENFPSFTCGVLLNSSAAEAPAAEPEPEPAAQESAPEPEPAPVAEEETKSEPEPEPAPAPEPEPVAESEPEEPTPAEPETPQADSEVEQTLAEPEPEPVQPEAVEPEPVATVEAPAPEPESVPEPKPEPAPALVAAAPAPPAPQPVAPQPVQPAPTMAIPIPAPAGEPLAGLQLTAREILDSRMAWATPEDSVEDVLNLMQQHDVGYAFVGENGNLEGIVSKSDIMGALSPYLRPVFAKWRRPADDATLTIKVKWAMTRPVRTITPETSVSAMMDQMCRFGGRCLPVVESTGQVIGMVTVFDILRILNQAHGHTAMGRTPQAPCMQV